MNKVTEWNPVALVIDRRALMASALFYLLFAVGSFVASRGPVLNALPLVGLLVGIGLLLLSAFWGSDRRRVLSPLPDWLVRRLPPPPPATARPEARSPDPA